MTPLKDLGPDLQRIFRAMLTDPGKAHIDGRNLRYAVVDLAPDMLLKITRWGVCCSPVMDTRVSAGRAWRIRAGREYRRSVLPRFQETRTIDFGDGLRLKFAVHPASSDFMTRVLPEDRLHEPELVAYLKQTVRRNDLIVDIGAHVGYVACIASALGATVIAAEIQPTLIPMIQLNAALNNLWRIHPLCVEIGARSGIASSYRVDPSPGLQGNVAEEGGADGSLNGVNMDLIPRLTLDSLLNGSRHPTLVKIDVEGAEGLVLSGARELIRAGRTKFMVEVHAKLLRGFNTRLADLLAPFEPDRWSMSILTPDGLLPLSRESFVDPAGPVDTGQSNTPVLFEPKRP